MTHKFTRTISAEIRANADDRVVSLAISSEEPYERWFGIEILDHKATSVDLSRLADNSHPLLLGHDSRQQIGVCLDPELGDDRVLRVKARFSKSKLGEEILQDVRDGIRKLVSVGYSVEEVEEEKTLPDGSVEKRRLTGDEFRAEMRARHGEDWHRAGRAPGARLGANGGDTVPVFRVVKWVPFEASIVPIPADPTVGVDRAGGPAPAAPAGNGQGAGSPAPDAADGQTAGSPTAAAARRADPGGRSAAVPDGQPASAAPDQPEAAPRPTIAVNIRSHTMTTVVEKSPAELERERTSSIIAIGEQFARFVVQKDIAEACRNGHSVEQFKDLVMSRMETRAGSTREVEIGMTNREAQRYSIARAILASVTGDWSQAGLEREASAAVAKIYGRSAEGFYVPFDVWNKRDFNVGTATEAGNLVATDLRTDLYADALRNAMVLGKMGLRYLPGLTSSVAIPRKSAAATIGTLSEIGSAAESNPTIAQITLAPKRVGAYVEYSKQALIQSSMALEPMLRDDLVTGAAVLIENHVINGVGSSNQMTGIRSYTGIGTTTAGTNGAAPAWSHFVDLESACANNNAEPDSLAGYVINTRTRGKLKQTTLSTYLGFIWREGSTPVNGYRAAVSNNLPNNLTKGTSTTVCSAAIFSSDFSMGVLGLFGAPDVTVDPYSKADTGQVKITINQFADFGIRQPATFAKIEDLLSN